MKTKDGREFSLKRVPDSEGDNNRGWQVDEVAAIMDGAQVGYLKMSYIPKARFDDYYRAGVLSYLSIISGHHFFESSRENRESHEIAKFSDEKLKAFCSRTSWLILHKDYSMNDDLKDFSRTQLMLIVAEVTKRATETQGARFEEFKKHHLMKPLVDYIRVEEAFQRQGIGQAMYVEGAKWMASQKMRLYASGLQQPEARAAWERMGAADWVTKSGKRRFLDVAKIAVNPEGVVANAKKMEPAHA